MQSTDQSDSSGESERSSGTTQAADRFKLTPDDTSILKGHLEDFQKGDTDTRKKILEMVMGEMYALRPVNSPFDKKVAKEVFSLKYL